jgi:transcriptional regulator of acetoin/glycerol metabolism
VPKSASKNAVVRLLTLADGEGGELGIDAIAACGGNQSEAARRLGVTRTTLLDKLKRHRLPR